MSNHDDTVMFDSVKNETKFGPGWRRHNSLGRQDEAATREGGTMG